MRELFFSNYELIAIGKVDFDDFGCQACIGFANEDPNLKSPCESGLILTIEFALDPVIEQSVLYQFRPDRIVDGIGRDKSNLRSFAF